ncbi:MAG: neutral/alkaline non-lysosomal ceramidase N-terminal domain-containing protein [Flavisolibacter sp.]
MNMEVFNRKKTSFWLIIIIAFGSVLGCAQISGTSKGAAPKIKVGVGEAMITPPNPVGFPMAGYDRGKNTSTGVHDQLYARSIVVEGEGGASVVLMSVAVVNVSEEIIDKIRTGVQTQTGIPFKSVAISSTHTHSGPVIGNPDSSYARFFIARCVESAVQAWKHRVPGKIGFGSTEIFGLAYNDRRMNHGGIPVDPEAAVIKIEDAQGKLMGVFFNFGCHPSALDLHNLLFTEDWPYYAIKGIKDQIGANVMVGYFQSAQGDAKVGYQAELSAVGADMNGLRTFDFAEKKGRIMTDAVLKLLPSIQTSGDLQVQSTYDHFSFPRRTTFPYTHAQALSWQKEAQTKLAEKEKQLGISIGPRTLDTYKVDLWLANQAVSKSQWIENHPNPAPILMPMQAIRLGNTVFVTFPSEVFTEIGLEVKQQSPYKNTFILGVAGDFGGYLPTAAEYLEQGYAVNGSPFAPECEQVMVHAAHELIIRVTEKSTKLN